MTPDAAPAATLPAAAPVVVGAADAGEAARDALALGARLAGALGAPLVLAGVWPSPFGPADGSAERQVRAQLEQDLGTLAAGAGMPAQVRLLGAPSVVRGLHRVVEQAGAAILVLGASHLGRLGRLTRGDVARLAVQSLPCAVAVAPAGSRDRPAGGDVLVGWDAAPEAEAAVALGAALARGLGGALRLAHAVPPVTALQARRWMGAPEPAVLHAELRTAAEAGLDQARAAAGDAVAVRAELLDGDPAGALRAAAGDAAALVVGSRRHGVLGRLALGSTSAELLGDPPVPVVVLPRTAAGAA